VTGENDRAGVTNFSATLIYHHLKCFKLLRKRLLIFVNNKKPIGMGNED